MLPNACVSNHDLNRSIMLKSYLYISPFRCVLHSIHFVLDILLHEVISQVFQKMRWIRHHKTLFARNDSRRLGWGDFLAVDPLPLCAALIHDVHHHFQPTVCKVPSGLFNDAIKLVTLDAAV